MIDPDWFSTVRCLTGANLGDDEVQRLAKVLGEQEEVLPYLLRSEERRVGKECRL